MSSVASEEKNMEIHWAQNSVLICEKIKPCKVSIEFLLRENVISEEKLDKINTFGITKEEIMSKIQVSHGELEVILAQLNPLMIDGKYYRISEAFMIETGCKLLMLIADNGLNTKEQITLEDILNLEASKEIFWAKLLEGVGPKILSNVLSEIYDIDLKATKSSDILNAKTSSINTNCVSMTKNLNKILAFSGRILLNENDSYEISDFIKVIIQSFEIVLDQSSLNKFAQRNSTFDPKDNIFEGYSEMDLSFMKGYAYVEFKERITDKGHILKAVDYYNLGENCSIRLDGLYSLKEKWTKKELEVFLSEFLEDYKEDINVMISKNLKSMKEINPFDKNEEIIFYAKKF